jgi:hypothetical protein
MINAHAKIFTLTLKNSQFYHDLLTNLEIIFKFFCHFKFDLISKLITHMQIRKRLITCDFSLFVILLKNS